MRKELKDIMDDIDENLDEDYALLVASFQRHTRCRKVQCLRYDKNKQKYCRFHYPKDVQKETQWKFNMDGDDNIDGIEIIFKRNDVWMNSHCPVICQMWRCNTDIQPITSVQKLFM